jgi:hypothetical protein
MEYEAHEMAASLFNGQRNARFPMKQRKRRFDEQYQLAGDAVMIAPVSNELPCKQGILQGISQKSAIVRRPLRGKRLSCSDFFQDSLLDLSGK